MIINNKKIAWKKVKNEYYLYNFETGKILSLGKKGASFWNYLLLNNGKTYIQVLNHLKKSRRLLNEKQFFLFIKKLIREAFVLVE